MMHTLWTRRHCTAARVLSARAKRGKRLLPHTHLAMLSAAQPDPSANRGSRRPAPATTSGWSRRSSRTGSSARCHTVTRVPGVAERAQCLPAPVVLEPELPVARILKGPHLPQLAAVIPLVKPLLVPGSRTARLEGPAAVHIPQPDGAPAPGAIELPLLRRIPVVGELPHRFPLPAATVVPM